MKQSIWILSILLALVILCGCAGPGRTGLSAPPESGTQAVSGPGDGPQSSPSEPQSTELQTAQSRYEPETADPDAEFYLADIEDLLARPASPYAEHVYSHQGTMIEEPSETFAAYDLALAYGSRCLEQDLVISADGVLYCSHDLTPDALTGETRRFSEMDSTEIDALRTKKGGQRLLRLSDVFHRYGTAVTYVIELRYPTLTLKPLYKLIEEYGMAENIIVQSPYLWDLLQVEQVYPDMPKLFLVYNEKDFEDALQADYVDIVCVSGLLFDKESCERVHAAGKKYCVAVCSTAESIRKAIEIGADCYFTDYTAKALMLEELYRRPAPGQ